MKRRVAVWGTGNVGRPAVRAVLAHRDLELVAVIVANPDKVGVDAGTICGIDPIGLLATDDWQAVLQNMNLDALVYTVNADDRPEASYGEVLTALAAGVNVVSTSLYPLLYPEVGAPEAVEITDATCQQGQVSVFNSGIDPGWAVDVLPIVLSGFCADIEEIRVQEIFNYSLYDQPDVVRNIIGFGLSMEHTPRMLEPEALKTVWGPMVAMIARALDCELDSIETFVERRPLEQDISVDGMGDFAAGSQGAFRFEVRGMVNGNARIVAEHITRISDDCAPEWAYPPEGQGCHAVVITGKPNLKVALHGADAVEPGPAGGGNSSAAARIVNAIPAVCDAEPGIVSALDLPPIYGGRQLRE